MNEKNLTLTKNNFFDFEDDLVKRIKNEQISLKNESCYIVKESWYNKFISNYGKNLHNFPEFIYDLNGIIECIKNDQKLKLINKEMIESKYTKKELKNVNCIKYYAGNNNIIIEFEKNDDNKSLLIRDFLEQDDIYKNSYIIILDDEYNKQKRKNKLYKSLLSLKDSDINFNILTRIISLEAYLILLNEYEENLEYKINQYEFNKGIYIKANKTIASKKKELEEKNKILEENNRNLINKIKELENMNINSINNDNQEDIIRKQKEINKKILFLENEEDLLEKMYEEMDKKNKMNIYLNQKNIELQNEISKNEIKLKEIISNIKKYKKEPEPIELYKTPTLIGLNNIGATCFMNATLQCLSQTKNLTNYFLKEINQEKINNIKNKNEYSLCPIYLDLIKNLWNKNKIKSSFSPYKFMNIIESMNPLFKKGQAGDSKDFIIFILEQLHKELKKKLSNDNKINEPLNQYDKNNALNHFFGEFKNECSIISDLFFGINETTNICLYCKNYYSSKGLTYPICYNYGIFNCIIFPLEEVKNMKIKNNQNNGIQIDNRVSIYECFCYNQKSDLFTGENKNYCNICKQLFDSIYTSKIFTAPNLLILILNRGKNNIYNVKLDFTEVIDITQFVLQKDKQQIIYSLYGVITHIGQSGPNAHFVASCKSPIDNKWYRYNDAMVNPINNIQKDIFDFGNPYILFYFKNI